MECSRVDMMLVSGVFGYSNWCLLVSYYLNVLAHCYNSIHPAMIYEIEQNGHLIRGNTLRHPSSGKPPVVGSYLPHSVQVPSTRVTAPYGMAQVSNTPPNKEIMSRSFNNKG